MDKVAHTEQGVLLGLCWNRECGAENLFFYSPCMLLRPVCCCSNVDKSETATRSQAFRRIYPVASLSPSAGAGGAAVRDAAEQLLRQLSVSNGCLHARNFLDVVDTENAHTQIVSAAPFLQQMDVA